MSERERNRGSTLRQEKQKPMGIALAAAVMRASHRQFKRLWRRYKQQGDAGLAHRSPLRFLRPIGCLALYQDAVQQAQKTLQFSETTSVSRSGQPAGLAPPPSAAHASDSGMFSRSMSLVSASARPGRARLSPNSEVERKFWRDRALRIRSSPSDGQAGLGGNQLRRRAIGPVQNRLQEGVVFAQSPPKPQRVSPRRYVP